MVYWETAHTVRNQPQFVLDFASQWQEAEKIVYSRTLVEPRSARTRIEPSAADRREGGGTSPANRGARSLQAVVRKRWEKSA